MSSEDANDYLSEMAQGNSQNVNEFRIMTSSLEKIVQKIQNKKQSRKLGRYPMATVYRIQPSTRQCENAARIIEEGKSKTSGGKTTVAGDKAKDPTSILRDISIPMFTIKGLFLQRGSGEVF